MFLVCALGASMLRHAPTISGIWWAGAAASGWGVNMIQSQDFIFATFFVYGPAPAKTPIWYARQLDRASRTARFRAASTRRRGPALARPGCLATTAPTQVGTATFTPTSTTTGTLTYNVGSTVVTKSDRAADAHEHRAGRKLLRHRRGRHLELRQRPRTTASRSSTSISTSCRQNTGGQLQIDALRSGSDSCTIAGSYVQEGLLFRIPTATYVCKSGTRRHSTRAPPSTRSKGRRSASKGAGASPNRRRLPGRRPFAAVFP